ncbi:hypothetical protein BD413DRAFT_496603 [Trametes elegans]|nr:hypothetical protein BD413DRAFT_496603 [Trametes elegans]
MHSSTASLVLTIPHYRLPDAPGPVSCPSGRHEVLARCRTAQGQDCDLGTCGGYVESVLTHTPVIRAARGSEYPHSQRKPGSHCGRRLQDHAVDPSSGTLHRGQLLEESGFCGLLAACSQTAHGFGT